MPSHQRVKASLFTVVVEGGGRASCFLLQRFKLHYISYQLHFLFLFWLTGIIYFLSVLWVGSLFIYLFVC